VPFAVEGRYGSVVLRLIPAPRGTGLCIEGECGKILKIAGIKDVWSKTFGQTRTKTNLIYACFDALKKLMEMKIQKVNEENLGIAECSVSE
jgi:small subunit ribosomal protein S5